MLGNFNITLNMTKELPIGNSLQQLFFTQRSFVGKLFSEVTSYCCISFIETPLLTLPHFNNLVTLLLYVISAHFILLSFLDSLLNIGICYRGTCFLAGTVVIVIPHSFKNSFTLITNSIYTEAINFLLSTKVVTLL